MNPRDTITLTTTTRATVPMARVPMGVKRHTRVVSSFARERGD
jgi:hypothetical protein